jgi:hypothetical protein
VVKGPGLWVKVEGGGSRSELYGEICFAYYAFLLWSWSACASWIRVGRGVGKGRLGGTRIEPRHMTEIFSQNF